MSRLWPTRLTWTNPSTLPHDSRAIASNQQLWEEGIAWRKYALGLQQEAGALRERVHQLEASLEAAETELQVLRALVAGHNQHQRQQPQPQPHQQQQHDGAAAASADAGTTRWVPVPGGGSN